MKNFWKTVWFNLTHITFKGRTSRKEYLYWFLFHIAFSFAILLLISFPAKILAPHSQELSTTAMLMAMIYFLGVSLVVLVISIWKFVADVTVIVRRFQILAKVLGLLFLYIGVLRWWSLLLLALASPFFIRWLLNSINKPLNFSALQQLIL